MQRLFSSFAGGWPGGGLLVQRILIGAVLLHSGFACLRAAPVYAGWALQSSAALAGVFLMAGLWTPLVGLFIAVIEAWIALSFSSYPETPALLAIFATSLAMIGPGAWSMDARLFGRKHIVPGRPVYIVPEPRLKNGEEDPPFGIRAGN